MAYTRANAENESPTQRQVGWSVKTRFYLVIASVLAVLFGMFAIGKVGLDVLSAVRAYVNAEGLWSKGQAEAAYQLAIYVDRGDEAAYEAYLRDLAVPLSLKNARLELESPDPDPEALRRGFTDAGVPLADVDGMVWLFRRFGWLEHIQEAADIWSRADQRIAELEALGRQARSRIQAGDASTEELESLENEINALHYELSGLATGFSTTLGDAARWAKGLLVLVLVGFTLLGAAVCLIGLVLATRISTSLQRSNRDLMVRNRERSGKNTLHEHLQGDQRLDTMLDTVVRFLAEYVNAQIAAVYVAQGDGSFRLGASHGIGAPDGLPGKIAAGQGIVGQVARDGKGRLLENVPDDYLRINTALGEGPPSQVFVLPLLFGGETMAVLELGAVHPFDPADLRLLESVGNDLALSVQTLQARDRVDALLEETQQQAEELEAQQEELRQTNEELEAQQEELRQTNEELEAQATALEESQAELEGLNAALEEKTEAVEAKRAEVEQKNADLEETRKQLVQKARTLEDTSRYKSEFLANMSHELRTPLNSIILLSNLMSQNKDGNLTEKQVEFAQTVHSSGLDLLSLIDEVLDLSKVEAGQMDLNVEEINLRDYLSVLERAFRQGAEEKGLSFSVEIADEVAPRIKTDERRLGQILKNLLSNAIKFTEEGRVELEVAHPDPADALYRGQPLPDEPAIAFSVTDTGIGIPEEQLPLIFEAFQQAEGSTNRKYGGTGLGLSISRQLTELLGGNVFVDSTPGEGTRFTVVLPATLPARDAKAESTDEEPYGTEPEEVPMTLDTVSEGQAQDTLAPIDSLPEPFVQDDRKDIGPEGRCLLIVEDDRSFARILLDLARERGFMGVVAEDGRTGLQLAEYYKPSAVLLDIGLPDIDGMSIMERLKGNLSTRHIPVHVISGSQRKFEALKKGAVGFLRKPTNMDQLKGAFERIEALLSKPVRRLLVAVGDPELRNEVNRFIGGDDVDIISAASGQEALDQLSVSAFDCLLLAAHLPDMDAAELLKRIRSSAELSEMPVVAIMDDECSAEDRMTLERYADSVVVKDSRYSERLLDETALFLHRVEQDLPEDKRRMLRLLHDQEGILRDKTVLLVDDDMRNIFALSSILEERSMQTIVAKDGREALDRLEQHADVIDLVLMDIMMPEMDGYEATRRIREDPAFSKLPIIALTAKAMRGDRSKCIEAGANDYLAKPVDADRLLSMLRVWLYR